MTHDEMRWLREQLEKLQDKQEANTVVLSRLTISVEEHVRRTNLLEADIKPLKTHVAFVNATAKLLSVGGAAVMAAHSLGLF